MNQDPQNDRIINGLLKANIDLTTPAQVQSRLAQDILLVADARRSGSDDLWPGIWFLASILEREFTGTVFIKAGLKNLSVNSDGLSPADHRCSA